jgi:hypothetical protein
VNDPGLCHNPFSVCRLAHQNISLTTPRERLAHFFRGFSHFSVFIEMASRLRFIGCHREAF